MALQKNAPIPLVDRPAQMPKIPCTRRHPVLPQIYELKLCHTIYAAKGRSNVEGGRRGGAGNFKGGDTASLQHRVVICR